MAEDRFAPTLESVSRARRFALATLAGLPGETQDEVALMVSELATNAVLHARAEFRVRIDVAEGAVRVAVSDVGPGTPVVGAVPPPTQPHGRGLLIVRGLADDWGVLPRSGGGKTVWFRLAVRSAPAPSARA